jgi:DNA-binding YbaB/EbfC family protein
VLSGLANLGTLWKQAQAMSGKLEGLSDELRKQKTTGTAGGGMVEFDINGLQEVLACRIEPGLFESQDKELLEDLLRAAANDALGRSKRLHAEAMKTLMGGIEVPGLDETLAKLTGGGPPGTTDESDALDHPRRTD